MLKNMTKTRTTSAIPGMIRTLVVAGLFLLFMLSCPISGYCDSSDQKKAPEELIKAAYLYKFLFFTSWPETRAVNTSPDKDVIIGILGKDPFGSHFDQIEGHEIKSMNRKVRIKRYGSYKEELNLEECHILFICSSEKKEIEQILNQIRGSAILTVGDLEYYFEQGVMINLTTNEGRVRWELNISKAKESHIKFSSTLIQSALRVIPID